MEFTGKWRSEKYSDIFGTFTLISTSSLSIWNMKLVYDSKSSYRPDETIDVTLEGKYKYIKAPNEHHRIILRQKEFAVDQYFTLTLHSVDIINWKGYLTCIFPVDVVQLYEVTCSDSTKMEDESEDENDIVSVTI